MGLALVKAGGSTVAGAPTQAFWSPSTATDWTVYWHEFHQVQNVVADNHDDTLSLAAFSTGTGSNTGTATTSAYANCMGVRFIRLGTSAGSYLYLAYNTRFFNSSEYSYRVGARVRFEAVPDATDDYTYNFGFDSGLAGTGTDAVKIYMDRSLSATNLYIRTRSGGTDTDTDTGVALNNTSFFNLEIDYDPNASTATFYINGANVGTHTTNVTASDALYFLSGMRRTSMVSTRELYTDWMYFAFKNTSGRGSVADWIL